MSPTGEDNVRQMYASGKFDPRVYVRTFYSKLEDEEQFFLDSYHYIFSKKLVSGEELLDFGTGPTMQTMITASAYVQKITLCDFVEDSCEELRKWLRKDPNALDFNFLYDHVGQLENRDRLELESRVRSKVKDVIHCDVNKSNPLAPVVAQYDIIVSNLCLESAVTTRAEYAVALKNVVGLVKPKGYLLLSGSFGCTKYNMGDHTFGMADLTQEVIEDALKAARCKTLFWMILPRDRTSSEKCADFTHCYALVAQK